jgi:hypothetical protein
MYVCMYSMYVPHHSSVVLRQISDFCVLKIRQKISYILSAIIEFPPIRVLQV